MWQGLLSEQSIAPTTPVAGVYPSQVSGKDADLTGVTALDQCITEQTYVRNSITRSLIYNQVRFWAPLWVPNLQVSSQGPHQQLQGSFIQAHILCTDLFNLECLQACAHRVPGGQYSNIDLAAAACPGEEISSNSSSCCALFG